MGGGAALFDMDADGDLDLYLVQSGSVLEAGEKDPPNRLYRNRGDGTFEDATAGSGTDVGGYGMGVASGDYDNDGDADLYVTNAGPNVLLRNDGQGRFTDVTAGAGVAGQGWSTSAAFVDYDTDGDLDLFVLRYINWASRRAAVLQPDGQPRLLQPAQLRRAALQRVVSQQRQRHVHGRLAGCGPSRGVRQRARHRRRRMSIATAGPTCSSPTTRCRTSCGSTRARAASRTGRS